MSKGFSIVNDNVGKDVQRGYMFQVEMLKPSGVTGAFDDMILRAKTVSIPGKTTEAIEVVWMGTKQRIPGKTSFGDTVTITFDEFEDLGVLQLFQDWGNTVFNWTNGTQSKPTKELTTKIVVKMFDTEGKELPVAAHMYNCWPKEIPEISLDMNASDKVTRAIGFSFDYIEFKK